MKCHQAERSILLAESCELTLFGRRRLDRHLASCAACRAYRADLERIAGATMTDEAALPGDVVQSILRTARGEHSRSVEIKVQPRLAPWSTWQPALLYSALSVLLLTGFLLIVRPYRHGADTALTPAPAPAAAAWDSGFDADLAALGNQVSLAQADWLESNGTAGTEETDELETMAKELLELEGQEI